MEKSDATFSGSVPEHYDRFLGPLLFAPYADDLAARVRSLEPQDVLEIAAGTGIVTQRLAAAVPHAAIVATDLNPGMIAIGQRRSGSANVRWQRADAMNLAFPDAAFDAVVCQYGVMFFPDIERSFREVRRVLKPRGTYLFNVWRSLDHNPSGRIVSAAAAAAFPDDPPNFMARTPFGHDDPSAMVRRLRAAGFESVTSEHVTLRSRAERWADCARGYVLGSPLRSEIEARDASKLDAVVAAIVAAGIAEFGPDPVDVPMNAHVFTARA